MIAEEDFIRDRSKSNNSRTGANEEFKSYLSEILGDISQRNSIWILENLLVSFTWEQYTLFDYLLNTPVFLMIIKNKSNSEFELDTANLLTEDFI